jgi:hypothetical protein
MWTIVDSRTGNQATVCGYFDEDQARRQIQEWVERDARGGRPDVHDLIPHLVPRLHQP